MKIKLLTGTIFEQMVTRGEVKEKWTVEDQMFVTETLFLKLNVQSKGEGGIDRRLGIFVQIVPQGFEYGGKKFDGCALSKDNRVILLSSQMYAGILPIGESFYEKAHQVFVKNGIDYDTRNSSFIGRIYKDKKEVPYFHFIFDYFVNSDDEYFSRFIVLRKQGLHGEGLVIQYNEIHPYNYEDIKNDFRVHGLCKEFKNAIKNIRETSKGGVLCR